MTMKIKFLTRNIGILFSCYLLIFLSSCAPKIVRPDPTVVDLIKSGKAREERGWVLVENKPQKIKYRVLLLPGFLCTDCIYADMLNDPLMLKAGIQLAAGNPPGFKGQPANKDFDYTIESYAKEVEAFNSLEPFDLIVGHSFFANVMIEVAARNQYSGPIMLISPSLYREAEGLDTCIMDDMSRIPGIGHLSLWIALQMPESLLDSYFTKEKQDKIKPIAAEAEKTPPAVARVLLNSFFDYIDKYGNLTDRLLTTHHPVWYVRGDKDNIKFSKDTRKRLNESPLITIKDVPGGMHFIMIDQPHTINRIILEILLNKPVKKPYQKLGANIQGASIQVNPGRAESRFYPALYPEL